MVDVFSQMAGGQRSCQGSFCMFDSTSFAGHISWFGEVSPRLFLDMLKLEYSFSWCYFYPNYCDLILRDDVTVCVLCFVVAVYGCRSANELL